MIAHKIKLREEHNFRNKNKQCKLSQKYINWKYF